MRATQLGGLALAMAGLAAGQAQAEVVISQVYGGGGNSGAVFAHDFVELFNNGDAPVALGGLSLQYGSAAGSFGSNDALITALPAVSIQPGQYFLIELAAGANTALPALPEPDASGDSNAAGASGKFALVLGTSALGCSNACSSEQLARIVDLVGYGSANAFEGSGAAPTASNATAVIRAAGGCQDSDDNAADFALVTPAPRNSQSPRNPCSGDPENPVLSIADVALPEGDAGTSPFEFTITLFPALDVDTRFDIATADGSAVAGVDYAARALTDQVIAAGDTSYTFSVDVYGNLTPEQDKTFHVNVSGISAGTIELADIQALGTIVNDDFALTPISAIQGETDISPLLGQAVVTEGIVTAIKSNGYFIQTPDGADDGNPLTSEGLFIFTTAGGVPATAAVGNRVRVQGTVAEYTPASAPQQLSLTQLTFAETFLVSTGNPLPTPVELTAEMANADSPIDNLEPYEGMRVSVAELEVVAPTLGSANANTGASSSNGVFVGVVAGVARPFREPGIGVLDTVPVPEGVQPPVYDTNPERLRIDSRAQPGAAPIDVNTGALVTGLVGVLDYAFRTYSILPDPGAEIAITGGAEPTAVSAAAIDEVTIGSFNLLNFPNAPNALRLGKTANAICQEMGAPDVVGLSEALGAAGIQALANAINSNLPGTCPEGLGYVAHLPGNPNGSIAVGFLVNQAELAAGLPRVEVESVTQMGAADRFSSPDGSQLVLNDRPPVVLAATVNFADGRSVPLTVIANHLRSLIGIDDAGATSGGYENESARVRDKRARQAEYLAQLVEDLQTANPDQPVVLVGDFNAFEFNDGYADVMGIITGMPAAEDEVIAWRDSPLGTPLLNLALEQDPAQRYSYVYDGSAQTLDHILVNGAVLERFEEVRIEHARINADFATVEFGNPDTAARTSDHDPAVAFLKLAAPTPVETDLAISLPLASLADVRARFGQTVMVPVRIENLGPGASGEVGFEFRLDAGSIDAAPALPEGWACSLATTVLTCTSGPALASGEALDIQVGITAPAATGRSRTGRIRVEAAVSAGHADTDAGNDLARRELLVL